MNSVSGSASTAKPTFQVVGRMEKNFDPARHAAATKRARQLENERKLREARAQAKFDSEMMAVEYARTLMERDLFQAIELEKTNPELAAKLRGRILDRAIGKVPLVDAEEAAVRKKGGGADALIDFMRAVTVISNQHAGIGHAPGTPVPDERDVTPTERDPDAQWFERYPTSTEDDDHE